MPRIQITKEQAYRGFQLYQGIKSSEGFNTRALDSLLAIGEAALGAFSNPVAFHIILDSPSPDRLGNIPEVIVRWDSSALYIQAREVRPRLKTPHVHLHILCNEQDADSLKRRVYQLATRLQQATLAEYSSIPPRKLQGIAKVSTTVCITTGEVLKTSSHTRGGLFHYLKHPQEFTDWVQRASYLAKVSTKDSKYMRTFTCTDLKSRQTRQLARETSESLLQRLQASASTYSTASITKVSASLYSPFNAFSLSTMSDKRCLKPTEGQPAMKVVRQFHLID